MALQIENSYVAVVKIAKPIQLRTKAQPHFYVHELKGSLFASFVPEQGRGCAAYFPTRVTSAEEWRKVIEGISGCELEVVETLG